MLDIAVPDSVLELIAVNTDSNIRELEGNLNRLTAYANLTGQPITEELCRTALRDLFEKKERTAITAEGIMKAVCEYFSISVEDLVSPSRRREITVPRQIAMRGISGRRGSSSVQQFSRSARPITVNPASFNKGSASPPSARAQGT